MARARASAVALYGACLIASAGVLLPACDQGQQDDGTVVRRGGRTSGGEQGEQGGERGDRGDLESPPGSRGPDEFGDDDLEGGRAETPATGGGTAQTGTPASQQESPWGRPEVESGEPLPPRRPLSGAARDAYRRGLEAGQRGDTEAARRAFEEALRADPSAFRAAYNLGVLADRSGNADGAMSYYMQSLRIQPDYERAAEGVVTIHVRRGRAPDAVAFMEPLARRWIRNLHIQALYGEALIHANRPDDAVQAARTALRRDERFVPAMLVLVKANLRRNRTELAQSILDQAVTIDPNHAEVQFLRGRMLQEQGQLGQALQAYRRAVELRPDYADARMALALQLLAGANYPEAVQQFEAVARLVAGVPEVHLGLGNAYRATKQWEKSKNELDRVVGTNPRSPEAHYGLALLYLEAGENMPGSDLLTSLQRSQQEFRAYRDLMGPRLARDDPSGAYLEEIQRQIEREQRRIERDAARRQREAERAAREGQSGGSE